MKFKIEKGTPLYEALVDLHVRGREAEKAAEDWIKNYFGKSLGFASPPQVLWGGIAAVNFPRGAKRGWKQINAKHKLYTPKSKEIQAELKLLPIVPKLELKEMFNYGEYKVYGGRINTIPSVRVLNGVAVMSVPDDVRGYKPVDGMVEILGSEFNRLIDDYENYLQNRLAVDNATSEKEKNKALAQMANVSGVDIEEVKQSYEEAERAANSGKLSVVK